jgi:hypothetical protein
VKVAERGGFEQSEANPEPTLLQGNPSSDEPPASLTASLKPVHPCPELSELSQAWPKLPINVRKAILALIRATLDSAAR